jgi:hypothetical protein
VTPLAVALALAPAALDAPAMTEAMHSYFHGEKWEGPFFAGAGVLAGGAGAFLLAQPSDLARGAAWPLLGVGLIQLAAGAVVFFRTDAQVAALDRLLLEDPARYRNDETSRIGRVNTTFRVLIATEIAIAAGGLAAAGAGRVMGSDVVVGIGLGLLAQGLAMLVLDAVAMERADRYTEALDAFRLPPLTARTP